MTKPHPPRTQTELDFNTYLGMRITKLRVNLKLNQHQFAPLIKVSNVTLCQIEKGHTGMSAYRLVLVANAFNMTVDDLIKDL